ncbi:MAG: DUF421 domain-containing protein [Acidimicrobiales bacterium]
MDVVWRAVAVYLFLWFLLRVMGKRELAEMTAFELVLLVVTGDLVQQGVTQEDFSVTGAFLAAGTIGLLVVMTSAIGWRWRAARPFIEGRPLVIVRDGHVFDDVLRLEHITHDELREAARGNGIADIDEVSWCVLEPDGRFSFLRRDAGEGDDSGGAGENETGHRAT